MRWPRTVARTLRGVVRRGTAESELDEELCFHLEMETERNVARGMTSEDARKAARRAIGGVELTKEQCRDARGLIFLETARQDLSYAVRTLRRTPAFAALGVLTLAVGIGANTAIFSVVNGVLLRPLAVPKPSQVVRLYEQNPAQGDFDAPASSDNFLDWRGRAKSFEAMTSYSWLTFNVIGLQQTDTVEAMHVTSDFFRVLGVGPFLGRAFLEDEYPPATLSFDARFSLQSHPRYVVLSYALWQRALGGSPDAIGRTIKLGKDDVRVVGVMPPNFSVAELLRHESLTGGPDCWIAEGDFSDGRRARFKAVLARLKDGVTVEQAQAEMDAIARQLAAEHPREDGGWGVAVVPLKRATVKEVQPQIRVLAGAVAILLLIACANVANLLLVRTAGRRRELAARAALGASRWRLVRQLLTETMLVSAGACVVGLLFAFWGVHLLLRLAPPRLPRLNEISLDFAAFFFSVAVSLLTGFLCGVIPALRGSAIDVITALKDEGRATIGKSRRWFSSVMVVTQTALALVLLIGAGLLAGTVVTLSGVSLGFDPSRVLSVSFRPLSSSETPGSAMAFYRELLQDLRRVPDIEAAAIGRPPLSVGVSSVFTAEGDAAAGVRAPVVVATPGYFRVLGIPLIGGRVFDSADTTEAPRVAIVSRSLASKIWPRQNPVGRRITSDDPARSAKVIWMTVVGVVGDVRNAGLDKDMGASIYLPLEQNNTFNPNNMLVRASGHSSALITTIRSVVRRIDKERAVTRAMTVEESLWRMVAPQRFNLFVIGIFSVLAFVLALVGIYGVVAQTVVARTREIATRTALGASTWSVLLLVVRQSVVLIATGEVIGVGLALALNRSLKTMVFGVTPTDASTYATITVLWAVAALLACAVPALHAMRIDPIVALKTE